VSRKWLAIGAAILVFAAGGGIALRLRAHKLKPAQPAPAAIVPSENNESELTGPVQPQNSILVAAPIEGTLEAFFVDVNQEVYEGQLLGRIHNADLDTAQQQAHLKLDTAQTRATTLAGDQLAARLETSRATVDQSRARVDVDRFEKTYQSQRKLWDLGATARLTFEKAQKDYDESRKALERADASAKQASDRGAAIEAEIDTVNQAVTGATAALDRAKADVANAEIHSPADGIVMARRGAPGELVDLSVKDLFQIGTKLTSLQVSVSPNPATLARIHPGKTATVHVTGITLEELTGTVREVHASEVIVDFTSPAALTKLDLTAQVKLKF
jgi:multidrug resistance efflux pump